METDFIPQLLQIVRDYASTSTTIKTSLESISEQLKSMPSDDMIDRALKQIEDIQTKLENLKQTIENGSVSLLLNKAANADKFKIEDLIQLKEKLESLEQIINPTFVNDIAALKKDMNSVQNWITWKFSTIITIIVLLIQFFSYMYTKSSFKAELQVILDMIKVLPR